MEPTIRDKNFIVETNIKREGLKYIDIEECDEMLLHGVQLIDGKYRRLPEDIAKSVNECVDEMHDRTAGGRVRFITNSPYIAIHAEMVSVLKMNHFAITGSVGMDLYSGTRYYGTFVPPFGVDTVFESVIDLDGEEREYTINLPLYSGVKRLFVGIKEGCTLKAPSPYRLDKPVVYYGSSITQGGCASRPGVAYQAILTRELHVDHINMGFSGGARGEDPIVDYVAGLEMSAFVSDYDHNAPTADHLRATHEKLYRAVRKNHPDIPILFLTRPKFHLDANEKLRLEIVKETYEKALSEGDSNVYFIPGPELLNEQVRECCLVDNTHPTDAGFVSMAYAILPTLKKMLNL